MENEFVNYILDLLLPYGDISVRAMFGGYGIYNCDIIVGIIAQDELYFKVDKESAKYYENAGSKPFTYDAKGKRISMSYWQVPIEIMEDEELLGVWLERALRASFKAAWCKLDS